ncbi:hypothetical protein GCM10027280_63060 [Micromonospora polyrhachis]|uniref:Lipoprotein n=1 Tax=Micromonospora polyrhachis TaxID=1282883 RepID=A0A7W7WPM2_9ACTN|nr:hypothetical protein [Micromonospora polyrhachis]MBB4959386.1 hypothetical protein [Micromonospora polyrhachis]
MRRAVVPIALALLLAGVAGCADGGAKTAPADPASPSVAASQVDPKAVTEHGVGPIRIGAQTQPLVDEGILKKEADGFCPLSWSGVGEWTGIWVLPDDSGSRIAQVYITAPAKLATIEGIRVGSPEASLTEAYGESLRRYTSTIYAESQFDFVDHESASIAFYVDPTGNVKQIMVGNAGLLEMAAEYAEPTC